MFRRSFASIALAFVGCAAESEANRPPRSQPGLDDSGVDSDTATIAEGFVLSGDAWVSLPYVGLGDSPPKATIYIRNLGDTSGVEPLIVETTGPFTVTGDWGPLTAGEERAWSVTTTANTTRSTALSGTVTVTADGQSVVVGLSALVGNNDIPPATWQEDAWGSFAVLELPSAPFPDGKANYDDASVLIALPPGLADNANVGIVTHLHGHNATLMDVVETQYLREQFAISGRNAVLVVPQGPEESADGDFGKLDLEDGFSDLMLDVQAVLYRDGLVVRPVAGPVALTSHSGGYSAVANILQVGGIEIDAVHLFDSLYGYESVYADYILGGGRFRSVYTAGGGTDDNNLALKRQLANDAVLVSEDFGDGALADNVVTIGYSAASHGGCVSEDRAFGRWLAACGLAPAPGAPPELLAATLKDAGATVRWRADTGGGRTIAVETSADGLVWTQAASTTENHATIALSPWIRLRAVDPIWGNSAPSDRYGATGGVWLVVDGFDRVLDGSWEFPTHDFAALVGQSLGVGFSTASNEAVAEGNIKLGDFEYVLWLLGDESTQDITFSESERLAVESFLNGGGRLVVSGSEVGWATNADWLDDVLHASLAADDAGTLSVESWTVGTEYPEDYPDVLRGDQVIWEWATGGAAAVGWNGRVVVVGFGVENLGANDRNEALADLMDWLGG